MARFVYRGVVINASDETAVLLSSDFKADEKKAAAKSAPAKSNSK